MKPLEKRSRTVPMLKKVVNEVFKELSPEDKLKSIKETNKILNMIDYVSKYKDII